MGKKIMFIMVRQIAPLYLKIGALILLVFAVFLTYVIVRVVGPSPAGPVKVWQVAIDAGHGGYDPGIWHKNTDIMEKDLTLAIAIKLKDLLEADGLTALLIRDSDMDYVPAKDLWRGKTRKQMDLYRRLELVKQARAEILVSIHINAGARNSYGGAESFYSGSSEQGKMLAESIQNELINIPGMIKRPAKPASYYLLDNSPVPTVLVEVGYLTHRDEGKKLLTAGYQEKLAQAMLNGIKNYFLQQPLSP